MWFRYTLNKTPEEIKRELSVDGFGARHKERVIQKNNKSLVLERNTLRLMNFGMNLTHGEAQVKSNMILVIDFNKIKLSPPKQKLVSECRRCLIPMDGFILLNDNNQAVTYKFSDHKIHYCAGLCKNNTNPITGKNEDQFILIVIDPYFIQPQKSTFMPAFIDHKESMQWLDTSIPLDDQRELFKHYDADYFIMAKIGETFKM